MDKYLEGHNNALCLPTVMVLSVQAYLTVIDCAVYTTIYHQMNINLQLNCTWWHDCDVPRDVTS